MIIILNLNHTQKIVNSCRDKNQGNPQFWLLHEFKELNKTNVYLIHQAEKLIT